LKVPSLGLEAIQDFVKGKEEVLRGVKHTLTQIMQNLDKLMDPAQATSAMQVSIWLFIFSLALTPGLHFAWWILQMSGRPFLFFAGTAVIAQNTESARRLRTVCKANWDYLEWLRLRAIGPHPNWAFFVPDNA